MKCTETFLIYIYIQFLKIVNNMILINIIFESPFHIKFFSLLYGFFFINHMFKDIHKLAY
jgi:hypothetical protein